jgi:hypothetical protein
LLISARQSELASDLPLPTSGNFNQETQEVWKSLELLLKNSLKAVANISDLVLHGFQKSMVLSLKAPQKLSKVVLMHF